MTDAKNQEPAAQPAQQEATKHQPDVSALEGDDTFEEFAGQVPAEVAAVTEEGQGELWQADWDDEDTSVDFASRLKQELDRQMKD